MIEEYNRLQKNPPEGSRLWVLQQRNKEKSEEVRIAAKAREAEKLAEKKKQRDAIVERFEEKFGKLTGTIVFAFPGCGHHNVDEATFSQGGADAGATKRSLRQAEIAK